MTPWLSISRPDPERGDTCILAWVHEMDRPEVLHWNPFAGSGYHRGLWLEPSGPAIEFKYWLQIERPYFAKDPD